MANKPTEDITWAEGAAPVVTEPVSKRPNGHPVGSTPGAGEHNWQFRALGRHVDWLADGGGNYDTLEDFIAATADGDRGVVQGLDPEKHVGQKLEELTYTTAATGIHGVASDGQYVFVIQGDALSATPQCNVVVFARDDLTTPVETLALTWGQDVTNDNRYHRVVCNGTHVAVLTTEGVGATPLSAVTVCAWDVATLTLTEEFYLRHGAQAWDIAIDGAYAYMGGAVSTGVTTRAIPLDLDTGGANKAPGNEVLTVSGSASITTDFVADDVVVASAHTFVADGVRRKDHITITGSTSNDGTYLVAETPTLETTLRVMDGNGNPVVFVAETAAGTCAVQRGWNHNHTATIQAVASNGQWVVAGGLISASTIMRVFDLTGVEVENWDNTANVEVPVGGIAAMSDRFFYIRDDVVANTVALVEQIYKMGKSASLFEGGWGGVTRVLLTAGATSVPLSNLAADDRYVLFSLRNGAEEALVIVDWTTVTTCAAIELTTNPSNVVNSAVTDGDQFYATDKQTAADVLLKVARNNRARVWRRVVPSLENQVLPMRQLAIPEGG